jgi:hypothetical protein
LYENLSSFWLAYFNLMKSAKSGAQAVLSTLLADPNPSSKTQNVWSHGPIQAVLQELGDFMHFCIKLLKIKKID